MKMLLVTILLLPSFMAMKFKIVSPTTASGWAWDVKLITLTDNQGNNLPVTNPFDSGHYPHPSYYPSQAFINKYSWWGGRKNSAGVFEIGGETLYPTGQTLTVEMIQYGNKHSVTREIENRLKAAGNGVKFLVEKNGNWEELCILKIKQGSTMSCTANMGMKFKIVSPTTASGWAWDVKLITLTDNQGNNLPVTNPFDSGHYPHSSYYPSQAFINNNGWWGGRKGSEGVFEIGGTAYIPSDGEITVLMNQFGGHVVTEAIQNQMEVKGKGVKFMVERHGNWDELCTLKTEGKEGSVTKMSCTANMGMKFKIVSPTTASGWAWDVKLITLTDDQGNNLPVTNPFDSGHYPHPSYYPFQAFTNKNSWWGGRKNSEGVFEIGGETRYPTGQTLTVEMIQNGNTHAVTQVIENLLKASGNSVKLLVEKNGKWDELCILKIKQGITMSCTAKFR